jgi:hypothetical protein
VLVDREIPTQTDTVYLSFLYQSFNTTGNDFIQAGYSTGGDPGVTALDRNGDFQGRSGGSTIGTGLPSKDFATDFLVLRAAKTGGSNYEDVDLYVNPTSSTEGSNTSTAFDNDSGLDLTSAAFLAIRKAYHEPGDYMVFDEFRIGTTFADVIASPPGPAPAQQVVLFEDLFNDDPTSNGWTELTVGGTNAGDIFDDNGQAVLASDGAGVDDNDFDSRSITRTIDATGFELLNVALLAKPDSGMEGDDILSIRVDAGDGAGFVEVFAVNDDFGTTTFGGMLPEALSDSVFDLRIQGVSNVEHFFLDNLVVTGRAIQPIPEPSTLALATLGLFGLIGFGRRRKR